jgi:DeoR/GlpR family transcriptional regulator of sugar metabolism
LVQKPESCQRRSELVGRAEQVGLDPQPAGSLEVFLVVVNHQRRVRRQAETVEQSSEDGGLWLRHAFPTGDDGAVKPTEKWKFLEAERIGFRFHVGQGIAGQPGFSHLPENLHRPGVDANDHLLAAIRPRPDELGKFGMKGSELGARCRGRNAAVMGRMPGRRTDLGEEPFHLRFVDEQLAVEVPGVPIEQNTAQVEDHCLDRRLPRTNVRTHISNVIMNTMDVQTRHQMILQALRQRSPVLVGELADVLDCSEMTVRRDLESLERSGGLRRVHGGAASVFLSAEETPYGIRALEFTGAKATIGTAAASLLADGETVILDGGTTAMEVARALRSRRLTVMPLALRPVFELHECPGITLLLPGGEVRPGELSLTGSLTEPSFSQLRFDTCVMGPCGIDAKAGITTHFLAETAVKRAAAKASQRVIAVADSSKLGRVAFGHVCDLVDIDILLTDGGADQEMVEELRTAGVDVRCV